MSMEEPHAHMGSQWSQFPLFRRLLRLLQLLLLLVLPVFFVHQFPPYPDVSFRRLPSLTYAIFSKSSSCLSTLS
jgi:hypothetical protein